MHRVSVKLTNHHVHVYVRTGQIVFPQLHSHLLGALNTGASLDQIRGILDQTEMLWGARNQAMVDGYWLDFVRRYGCSIPGATANGK